MKPVELAAVNVPVLIVQVGIISSIFFSFH